MQKIKRLLLFGALLSLSLTGCGDSSSLELPTSEPQGTESEVVSEDNSEESSEVLSAESESVSEDSSEELPSSSVEELTFPRLTFRATSPIDIPENAVIKVAGNFNSWSPLNSTVVLSQETGNIYSATVDFTEADVGTTIQYKYVLLYDDQTETNMWANVEGNATGGEIGNRNYKLLAGAQTKEDTIRSFKNNMDGNTVTRGTLQKVTLIMTQFEDCRERTIRIWLPDGYDPNNKTKKYPVLYMHDGQNLFDAYTSFSGEWEVDEAIGAMMDEGYGGTIVVGIDNGGAERLNEYSPAAFALKDENKDFIPNPSGEKYAAFVVETVKPYIEATYNVLTDRKNTGLGGSSMGGIISFYMALTYPEVFGYVLPFSSSHWLYVDGHIDNFINEKVPSGASNFPRLYFWVGGAETTITKYPGMIKNALLNKGYNYADIYTTSTPGAGHNEPAWADAFPAAYRWLVKFNQ